MTRRADLALAALLAETLALVCLVFLVWCEWRGFQPSLCEAYQQCGWRYA